MSKLINDSSKHINSSFPLSPFQNGVLNDIASVVGTPYGEPTALLSDDGGQIDLWFSYNNHPTYGFSSGTIFSGFTETNIASGYNRPHIVKDGSTYYLYAAGSSDTTIHLFTGTDKINFTDQGQVLGHGSGSDWDATYVANTFVWKEGSSWYMLYEGNITGDSWKIGLATANNPAGTWTKYGSNPVFSPGFAIGNPELPRVGSVVTKSYGRYYMYYHGALLDGTPGRAYSIDLHTWTDEGQISGIRYDHLPKWNGSSGWSYGDQCLVQFKGKTYIFWSPSNQVDSSHLDGSIDNRTELELLAVPPSGGSTSSIYLSST